MIRNKRLINDFKDYLSKSTASSSTYVCYYPSQTSSNVGNEPWRDKCNLYFFEWSNLSREPLNFKSKKAFFDFLDKSKIAYNKFQENLFNIRYLLYATCKKDKAELIICGSKSELEMELYNSFR